MQTAGSTFAVGQGPQKSNIRLFTSWILVTSNSGSNLFVHSCLMKQRMREEFLGLQ
ncbi:hypothetical protein Pan258_18040 [Symmachiella dynata]|nr:hypothetical protein Pan258_18040 [Symmachiella dynata]